jgi:CDP-diacylglycerol--glycerol-3-phosphate 3-phosphatidyltransferase
VPTGGVIGAWLRLTYVVARLLVVARVPPNAVTLGGLAVAAVSVPFAAAGRWALLAASLVALAGLLDGLDGAVAVIGGRVTRAGAVLDAVCDRVAELAMVAALGVAGAPPLLCLLGVLVALLHEYLRAVARVAGMAQVGAVTVSEKPTRVIITAMFLLAAGVYPDGAAAWAGSGAVAWGLVGLVGLGQLVHAVRQRLTG